MATEERLLKLEGMGEAVVRLLPKRIAGLEARLEALWQEVKAEIHTLFNRMMPVFTGLAPILGPLTFLC
ncbi:MAG: hypothetical protein ABDH20_03140 [Thermus sp.]